MESKLDDSDEASLIRLTRRDYERQIKVPPILLSNNLTERVAGRSLTLGPYIWYLKTKYGEIYRL